MSDFIHFVKTAQAACLKIMCHQCCYGTEFRGVPSDVTTEDAGCAELRACLDFLDRVEKGCFDKDELKRWQILAHILQAAFHPSSGGNATLPDMTYTRSFRSLPDTFIKVELHATNLNCKDCQPIKDGADSGSGCYEAWIIREALCRIRMH